MAAGQFCRSGPGPEGRDGRQGRFKHASGGQTYLDESRATVKHCSTGAGR
jgi:hypothetical protein